MATAIGTSAQARGQAALSGTFNPVAFDTYAARQEGVMGIAANHGSNLISYVIGLASHCDAG